MSDYVQLKICQGRGEDRKEIGFAKISHEDSHLLGNACWLSQGYPTIYKDGRAVHLHKFITNTYGRTCVVDHIDHDRTNATRENLRIVDYSINNHNRIRYQDAKRFVGTVQRGNIWSAVCCGVTVAKCNTEEEAAACYNVAARLAFGEHANLNQVDEEFESIPKRCEIKKRSCKHSGSVFKMKNGRFRATLQFRNNTHSLGTFDTETLARLAIAEVVEEEVKKDTLVNIVRNDMDVAILQCKGESIMVDDDTWYQFHRKELAFDANGYVRTGNRLLHRLVMKAKKGEIVDHRWHDLRDVRKQSLRIISSKQNAQNRKKASGTSSQYIGVSKKKTEKLWVAQVGTSAHVRARKSFANEIDAAKWYDSMVIKTYGPDAKINFVIA